MMALRAARLSTAALAIALGATALLLPQPAPVISGQLPAGEDSLRAERFLNGVRGASPMTCEMAVRSLGFGWGWEDALGHPDAAPEAREMLRWVSGGLEDPDVVPPLVAHLEDSDACVRRMAARLLGRTRHPRAVEALVDALGASNPRTRQLAAVGLGYAEESSTVDPLMRALRDQQAAVRAASAWALGEIEDQRPVAALARLLGEDPDAGVRRAAALALGEILD